jgi:hypothetical protein
VLKRALLLADAGHLRKLAAMLEDGTTCSGPVAWRRSEPPSALTVAGIAGLRLTQFQRSVPYALDGEQEPLIQIVLSAQSSARQLLAASTDDEALAALFALGKLRADAANPEAGRRRLTAATPPWSSKRCRTERSGEQGRSTSIGDAVQIARLLRDFA